MARQPITWQNVNAPSIADSARIIDAASRQFDKAFASANAINTTFGNHRENVLDANTAAFTNELLRRYQTPEAFEAARQSGEIDMLRSEFGGRLRPDETGASLINRLAQEAQQRQIGNMNYQNLQQQQAGDKILSQITGHLHEGNNQLASQVLAENIKNGTLSGALAAQARNAYDSEVTNDRQAREAELTKRYGIAMVNGDTATARQIAEELGNPEYLGQVRNRELEVYRGNLTDKVFRSKSEQNDNLRRIASVEDRIEQLTGMPMSTLNSNPEELNKLPVQTRLQTIDLIEQLNGLHGQMSNTTNRQTIEALAQQIADEQGLTRYQATEEARRIIGAASQAIAPTQQQQEALNAQLAELDKAYKHVPLVKDNLANVENPMKEVLGEKGMAKVANMNDEERREMNSFFEIVNRGYIPENFAGLGNKEKRYLTLTEAKFLFETTDDDEGWKDVWSTSILDRVNDLLEKPTMPAEQIRDYEEYLDRRRAIENQYNFENAPGREVSNFRLNNTQSSLVDNLFSMVQAPARESPEEFNRNIPDLTNETVDVGAIESRVAELTGKMDQAQVSGDYATANNINKELTATVDLGNAAIEIQKHQNNIARWEAMLAGEVERGRGRNGALSDTQLKQHIAKARKEMAKEQREFEAYEKALKDMVKPR